MIGSERLAKLLNIRPGEGRLALLMMVYSAFIGVSISYFFTAGSALFLSRFDIENLPYVFILSGVVLLIAQIIYQRTAARLTASQLLIGSLGLVVVGVAALRIGLALVDADWLTFSLLIWFRVMIMLLMLGFWGLANRLLNLEQSKRLFSLISAGNVISGIIGSFAVPLVVHLIGTENLFVVVGVGAALCLVAASRILNLYRDELAVSERPAESGSLKLAERLRSFFLSPYMLSILAIYLLAWTLNYLIDFTLFDRLQSRFADNPDRIASFIGVLFGIIYLTNFVLKFFIAGRLIARYGLGFALLTLPIVFTLGVFSSALIGVIVGTATLFFWAVIATKYCEEVLREAMNEPATRILYQPLSADQRAPMLALVEGTGYPLTAILAGGILAVFTLTGTFSALAIVILMLILAIAWVLLATRTYRNYTDRLRVSISRRSLSGESLFIEDAATAALLRSRLKSPYPGEVIYSLDLLEQYGVYSPKDYLSDLLSHPSAIIRREALLRIQKRHLTLKSDLIFILVENDDDPEVRDAALRVFCSLNPPDLIEKVKPCLEHSDPAVKRGALIGLLNHGGVQGMELAEKGLLELTRSSKASERALAAEILGEVENKRFASYMMNLLNDKDTSVQRAAYLATGKLSNPQFWSVIVKGLTTPGVATTAASALFMANKSVYPTLESIFNQPEPARALLISVARVCGRRRDAQAIELLESQFNFPDKPVRHQVRNSLSQCDYRAQGGMVPKVMEALREEASEAMWILAAQQDLGDDPVFGLVQSALSNELGYLRGRLFVLLSFLYDNKTILDIRDNLRGGTPEKRGYALETLEVTLSKPLKNMCVPILEDLPSEARLNRLKGQFPQPSMEARARLIQMTTLPANQLSDWIKTCALYTLAELPSKDALERILPALDSFDAVVRETALWTLYRLDAEHFQEIIAPSLEHSRSLIANLARQIMKAKNGEKPMLLTIERVLILKTVGIFSRVPDNILIEVAAILEEVELHSGDELFHEGDAGTSMFIIVSGKIRIQTVSKVVAERGERDFIGEMSLFDEQPRSATATALVHSVLLKLDQDSFDDLLANHAEMARGIISVLANRLREAMQQKGISPIMADIYDRLAAGSPEH